MKKYQPASPKQQSKAPERDQARTAKPVTTGNENIDQAKGSGHESRARAAKQANQPAEAPINEETNENPDVTNAKVEGGEFEEVEVVDGPVWHSDGKRSETGDKVKMYKPHAEIYRERKQVK